MYIQPAFQFQATDIPSSSTPPMFQAQPGGFDTGTDDQLPWYEMRVDDILATMEEGAEQQADEVGASQWTQPPLVLTQLSQLAACGATPAGGGVSLAGGGAAAAERHRRAAERHRPADRHRMVQARRRRQHRLPTS
jgi:hypothetical protein